jgi:3-dehydroquinate synthase
LISIPIRLPNGSYEIRVGRRLFAQLREQLAAADLSGSVLVISQPKILKAVGKRLNGGFATVVMPDGERAKTLRTVARLIDEMVRLKMSRQSTIVALGGGLVGDVAGFAASVYMRGVAVVQVPTTLLAQVDSSIGGKTAVNHRVAKNLIGTFHQPKLVLSDPELLETLPAREYTSGLYEALKYGVIRDSNLFSQFETSTAALLSRDPQVIESLVAACAAIKADVVQLDEREGGVRQILNFGHTVGHALEAAGGYRRLKHGEAVGYGMIAASRIAAELGLLSDTDRLRIERAVRAIGRLPSLTGFLAPAILNALQHDKKVRDGAVHFVLPRAIGQVEITADVPFALVRDTVRGLLRENSRTS